MGTSKGIRVDCQVGWCFHGNRWSLRRDLRARVLRNFLSASRRSYQDGRCGHIMC